MNKNILLILIFGLIAGPASAESYWQVAKGPSSVKFKVKHLMFSHVEGKFKNFEGFVMSADDNLDGAIMQAQVRTDSIYTGNKDRDHHLNSDDFFNTSEYPLMTFESLEFTRIDSETYFINGQLTIRGITHPIYLTAKCGKTRTLSNGKERLDLIATTEVDRFDYGLKWNEVMETGGALVGKEVEIKLKIALVKENSTPNIALNNIEPTLKNN